MRSTTLEVTGIRFLPARPVSERVGFLGHVTCVANGAPILGLTLRQTPAGRPCVAYPHQWSHGRQRQADWPHDDAARETIEAQILAELRRQGRLAS